MDVLTQQQCLPVCFTNDGIMLNGHVVGMPPRPTNETAATVFDVLSVVGVGATLALVLIQLVRACK